MDKVLNVGDEVLIFEYIREWGIDQDDEHYIRGNVVKSEMSDDLSYHGSPWHVMNYTVLGEDGNLYFGNYEHPILGNSFFMTQEDYIRYLEGKIDNNQKKILEINEENQQIRARIENVQKQEIKQLVINKNSKMRV